MKTQRWIVVALALAFVRTAAFSAPVTFRAHEDERDHISFTSKATLEKIVGRVGKSRGEIMVENLDDLSKGKVSAVFEVDLDSVKTGIELRDQHMRETFLETAKYPKAIFSLTKVVSSQIVTTDAKGNIAARAVRGLEPNTPTRLIAEGTLELHGKKRPIRVSDLTVTFIPESDATKMVRKGDLLRVEGAFNIQLADYGINRPQMLFMRIADEVQVNVDVTAGTGEEGNGMTSGACGACDGKKGCDPKKCGAKK
jgi:polyisoprenoid-binding protein YceI